MHDMRACTVGPRSVELRATFPWGVATARQLVEFGFPERTVYHRCRDGGPWQRILPGVVLLFTGRPTRDQQVLAAVLLCGSASVVTGLEACRRLGIRRGPLPRLDERVDPAEVHVLVPAERQVRDTGFVHVERSGRMPPALERGGLPLAGVPRACIDAARRLWSRGDVTELVSDPVQRGLCTVAALGAELDAAPSRGTAVVRDVLRDVRVGIRSAAEQDAKRLWRRTGLPEPWWNATIRDAQGGLLGVGDCWLDEVAMLWEIESTEWHVAPADHDRTVKRAAALTAAGVVYVASKPRAVRGESAGVVAMLCSAYQQAVARPRPSLFATPATGDP